ncbi:MAG: hypothetical protein FJ303_01440 [Planctomycetes bacterium]|nr:hypothetical protein [Planctomycetota bacterium]
MLMQPYYFMDTRYSALWAPAKQKVCRLEDVAMRPKATAAPRARDSDAITTDFDCLIDGAGDSELANLTDQLVSDFRADPKGALAALFGAKRPGEKSDDATMKMQLEEDRELLAGYRVFVRAFNLWFANAMPVAVAMLAESVQLGLQNKPPFTRMHVQNCLPDIPWLCLRFAAEMELRCGTRPRPVPGVSGHDGVGPMDLLRDWVVIQNDGRALLNPQSGLSDFKLRDLVRDCIELAERWQPTILHQFLQLSPQASSVQSIQLTDVCSMIAGASKFEPARYPGEDPYRAELRDRQRESFWASANPKRLRTAFKRLQAEENRWLLASLVRLSGIAEEAGRVGMRNWPLLTNALPDLTRVQLVASLSQAEQVEVLLDQLIGAQHCRRRA